MDEKTYGPQSNVERGVLRVIAADRYARETDPNADAESEHASELLALDCRELVDAVNAGDPREWPIGWACGEVGTGWPNGTDGGPVNTEPCRLRPDHDGRHDWAIAEDAAEEATKLKTGVALGLPLVTIENPDDEHTEIHVNGQVVAEANYDEHGSSGMAAVEKTALAVARAFGAVVPE